MYYIVLLLELSYTPKVKKSGKSMRNEAEVGSFVIVFREGG
jgi:hypothetical protein